MISRRKMIVKKMTTVIEYQDHTQADDLQKPNQQQPFFQLLTESRKNEIKRDIGRAFLEILK